MNILQRNYLKPTAYLISFHQNKTGGLLISKCWLVLLILCYNQDITGPVTDSKLETQMFKELMLSPFSRWLNLVSVGNFARSEKSR